MPTYDNYPFEEKFDLPLLQGPSVLALIIPLVSSHLFFSLDENNWGINMINFNISMPVYNLFRMSLPKRPVPL